MAQWTQGTVDLTNGSATVTGSGTAFLSSGAAPGLAIFVKVFTGAGDGSGVGYMVTAIPDDTTLSLEAAWQGPNASGVAYALNIDATPKGLALLDETSVELPALFNFNMTRIDGLL